jgi:hypothetical protein
MNRPPRLKKEVPAAADFTLHLAGEIKQNPALKKIDP